MIPLRLRIDPLPFDEPIVARLRKGGQDIGSFDAKYIDREGDILHYDLAGFSLRVHVPAGEPVDNDVLLLIPDQGSAHRLIRAESPHNTFLVTERCDQLCVMCSQPPKAHHTDLFPYFLQAAILAPVDVYLGISGGEPLLFKDQLFQMLRSALDARPDLKFHILTNGQHFEPEDVPFLRDLPHDRVLWGIPLYSTDPVRHDEIVAKDGAHRRLMKSLSTLARSGAAIELRTVVMKPNVADLPALSRFITTHVPFIDVWAIMQLESIGFGRKNWDGLFFDNSTDFRSIGVALDTARARGIETQLFNFPACTVPLAYRDLAPSTISDWKRRYLAGCKDCSIRDTCGGFFEWYPEAKGFQGIRAL